MTKSQRIRDPLHDLIVFEKNDFDQLLWKLVQSAEFQRLRRVKQLGFSELVYPGATHSRFSHSIGVLQTAKILLSSIRPKINEFNDIEAEIALVAALVHDLGHGPFSHAFEEAVKILDKDDAERAGHAVKKTKKHELWTTEIITGNTEIAEKLRTFGTDNVSRIEKLLSSDTPENIYASLVSSQFDADRLDYMRRDRLMTGAQHGGFDFSWLIANLEVAEITLSSDGDEYDTVESLVLGDKAHQAAEGYVLGLFQLYFAVYFHKATRSAESMLTAILRRLGALLATGDTGICGLDKMNPILKFIEKRDLETYLQLDDYVVWSSISRMREARDSIISKLSSRLINRQLYKSIDITAKLESEGDAAIVRFFSLLRKQISEGNFEEAEIFEDRAKRNPYKRRGYDSPEALSKIWIMSSNGAYPRDLSERSEVVKALQEKTISRVYVRDEDAKQKVEKILEEIRS